MLKSGDCLAFKVLNLRDLKVGLQLVEAMSVCYTTKKMSAEQVSEWVVTTQEYCYFIRLNSRSKTLGALISSTYLLAEVHSLVVNSHKLLWMERIIG